MSHYNIGTFNSTLQSRLDLLVLVESVDKRIPDFLFLGRNDVMILGPVSIVLAVIAFINVDYVELTFHLALLTVA